MKRKIVNPFVENHGPNDYNCFGCSPHNVHGIQLSFTDNGNEIEAIVDLHVRHEGFSNIMHGGIQATMHDEIAAWVVFTKCESSGVTKTMKVDYHKPLLLSHSPARLTGKHINTDGKVAHIETRLYNSDGNLCSSAIIEYVVFPLAVAKRKFHYPGVEAFYAD